MLALSCDDDARAQALLDGVDTAALSHVRPVRQIVEWHAEDRLLEWLRAEKLLPA